ncbi:MAG: hypothetical protein IJH12_02175 [Clostridia bacterium]|nr:hypothetical protein [Clostridia bacterium]
MSDYTTVRIKKSSLEKINKMKGEHGSVADVVEKLLSSVGGCSIDDILEINRDSVAITLEYLFFDGKSFHLANEYYITFQELRLSKVGDTFTANQNPADDSYSLDTAEVLFVDERSVLVRVTETLKSENQETSVVHMEHVDLF